MRKILLGADCQKAPNERVDVSLSDTVVYDRRANCGLTVQMGQGRGDAAFGVETLDNVDNANLQLSESGFETYLKTYPQGEYSAIGKGAWMLLLALPLAGYSFAWVGHFFFERNRPATFQHPFYSLLGSSPRSLR